MITHQQIKYQDRIVTDPDIMVGKPVIKGTRIPVELVLGFLAQKLDLNELFAAYPHLAMEDVQACLAFAQALVEKKRARRRPTSVGNLSR